MDERIERLEGELAAHVDYMQTIARATRRLGDAVGELMASLPPETQAQIARELAELQAAPNEDLPGP